MADERADCCADADRHLPVDERDGPSLEEALSLVGEETRARIVAELGAATRGGGAVPAVLSFSELMDRVGAEDSGRFNYHLGELVGTFVGKTDRGYVLRPPGRLVYRAIVTGALTDREAVDPVPVGDCPDCGGTLAAAYTPDHLLAVECEDCGAFVDALGVPPTAVEGRSMAAALDAAHRRRHHRIASMRSGVCHGCGGRVERSIDRGSVAPVESMLDYDVYATAICETCPASALAHPARVALTVPEVTGALAECDREAALVRAWDDLLVDARANTRVRDDGTVTVPFAVEADQFEILLDGDLQVDADPEV